MDVAQRSRVLSQVTHGIHQECVRRLRPNWKLDELVTTFNALVLPRGYVYVDPTHMLHLILIDCNVVDDQASRVPFPTSVMHSMDVIWRFRSVDGIWTTLKDRTGIFASLCPIQEGGTGRHGRSPV